MRPLAVVIVAVLGVLPAVEAPAAAPRLRCGAVVEEEAVLDRDLRCDGIGIVLKNPRSVLHLNGHTIESARTCADGAAPSGIVVERTAEGAQILGPGLVRGFVTGIAIDGAVRVQVREARVSDSCAVGMLIVGTDSVRVRDVILHRNGGATGEGGAIRIEQSARVFLDGADVFANGNGAKSAAVDLHDCDRCRVVANRIVANRGVGLRLDPESLGAIVERNVVLDHRPGDIVDQSTDGSFVFNVFERGDGIRPPSIWAAPGPPAPAQPAPAGCGVMQTVIGPKETATLTCPPTSGVRSIRNGIVSYRLLNPFNGLAAPVSCDPVEVRAPDATAGGSVRCTNPLPIYPVLLEATCCLN